MEAGAAIAEILKREGVEIIFGYPVNHILEFAARAGIRPIIVRQERTGIHMADAMSRQSSGERLGVFCMQYGPGTENAFGGVAQAWSEAVPLVVIPGGYPRGQTNIPPTFSAVRNFAHVTKSVESLTRADQLVPMLRRAFTQVRNGRPGPVLVEVPITVEPNSNSNPPVLTLGSCPADGDLVAGGGTVALDVAATDDELIASYTFRVNGAVVAGPVTVDASSLATVLQWTPPVDAPPGTLFDLTVEVEDATTHDATGYCPYAGMTLTGWPVTVIARGEVIVDRGELFAERGRGRLLTRAAGPAAAPSGVLAPELDPARNFGAELI